MQGEKFVTGPILPDILAQDDEAQSNGALPFIYE